MASPKSPPPPSRLAQARLALPDRPSQQWVADQISDKIGEVIGQQAISYWEKGKVDMRNVHPRKLAAYAEVLGLSKQELADAAGYAFEELFPDQGETTRPGPPIPPVVAHRETPVVIPPELQQVIDEHGDAYPELRDPVIQRIIAAPRNFGGPENGPQTKQEWLEYFLLTRRYLR